MSAIAIRVANLSKLYHLGRGQGIAGYRTLRESMMGWAKAPLRRFRRDGRDAADDTIWALKDVSFQVEAWIRRYVFASRKAARQDIFQENRAASGPRSPHSLTLSADACPHSQ